jgi:hypothetical protein
MELNWSGNPTQSGVTTPCAMQITVPRNMQTAKRPSFLIINPPLTESSLVLLKRKLQSSNGTLLCQADSDAVGTAVVVHYQPRSELVASVNAEVLG